MPFHGHIEAYPVSEPEPVKAICRKNKKLNKRLAILLGVGGQCIINQKSMR